MLNDEFTKFVENICDELKATLLKKGEEYADGGDRLKNFKDAAGMNECLPEMALWGFVSKHIIALKDFISDMNKGTKVTSGIQWLEKTGDIINYMILLRALLRDRGVL